MFLKNKLATNLEIFLVIFWLEGRSVLVTFDFAKKNRVKKRVSTIFRQIDVKTQ